MATRRMSSLDSLLRVRKDAEEQRARDAAIARQHLAAAERSRAGVREQQEDSLHRAAERLSRPSIDASDMRAYYQYERHLARKLDDCDSKIRELSGELTDKQAELQEAAVQRKMIERLRERRLLERTQWERKMERQAADEIAIMRARAPYDHLQPPDRKIR